jgi:hypothetical protein
VFVQDVAAKIEEAINMKTYFSGVADRNASSNLSRDKIQQKLNEKFVVFVSALEFELTYFLRSMKAAHCRLFVVQNRFLMKNITEPSLLDLITKIRSCLKIQWRTK